MKALLMISSEIAAKSPSFARRTAFVAPIHRWTKIDAFSTLPLQSSAQWTPQRYSVNDWPSPNNFQRRHCTPNHFSTENYEGQSPTASATATSTKNDFNPFSWSEIIHLFTDPYDFHDKTNNYIPSDHPNLAQFRRSLAAQHLYEEHKTYLNNNWKSPYDYLVYSKFGNEFGFKKELVKVDNPSQEIKLNHCNNKVLVTSPEGYRFQCNPSLSQASDYTIQNCLTYLKLVLNDFPYDVEEGIQHWCLWKIGGTCRTEGILMEELQWALQELNSFPSEGVGCGSSLIVKQNELTESAVPMKFSTFYWVNPPHLQSSKFLVACILLFVVDCLLLDEDQLNIPRSVLKVYIEDRRF